NSAGTLLCGGMAGGAGAVEALGRGAYNVGSWGKSKFWPDPIGNFTKAVLEGNTQAFSALMTFWVSVPLGSLGVQGGTTGEYLGAAGRGEEPTTGLDFLVDHTFEIQLVVMAISIIIGMGQVLISRQQALAEGATETAKMMTRSIVAVAILPAAIIGLHRAGDSFSIWILDEATSGNFDE